ncbi:MAG: hypothetical protein U0984_19685 [Prosthecobacter sp.]|nr:hypothetical protein [Prosthecobacter sp.]
MRTLAVITLALSLLAHAAGQQPAPGSPPGGSARKPATDGKVWGALIYATNDPKGLIGSKEQAPREFAGLQARLGKVFPYQHFEILGQHLQDVFREYESWVVPTKDLFLKVDSKGPAKGGGMNLHLQFWREQQVLVKTDATLRADSPLFIGGPKWREGQLIFVLVLQK